VTSTLLKDQWPVTSNEEDWRRRSIYLFVRRNLRYPLFDVFDRPDTNASCPERHVSTTAPQSLVLLNSKFSLESAESLARLLVEKAPHQPAMQIDEAYLRVLGRHPSTDEIRTATRFLEAQRKRVQDDDPPPEAAAKQTDLALVDFCLALFNSNEFVYLD
jgi:hypothetical protein